MIQGARSLLNTKFRYTTEEQRVNKDCSKFTEWMFSLAEKRGHNRTVVAVANKLARVVFAVLSNNSYDESKVCI